MAKSKNKSEAGAQFPASFFGAVRDDPPVYHFTLRPHRSLPVKGFVLTIAFTSVMLSLPLLPLLGTLALWGCCHTCCWHWGFCGICCVAMNRTVHSAKSLRSGLT